MQRSQTMLLNSAAASHEANYMRTTQASRSRSNAAGPKLPITRQSSDLVRNWAATEAATTAANNQNNSRGNLRRYAAIGLISRKKQSMPVAPISGRSDKENASSMEIQSRVATRRNLKAQQKAARKEFRHLLSNIWNNCDQQGPSAGNKKYQLGLRTRNNTPNDLLLATGQQKQQ